VKLGHVDCDAEKVCVYLFFELMSSFGNDLSLTLHFSLLWE